MPELAESADALLEVSTHSDAEIFLIGNDRQLIQRAVGKLTTRQPKGLYRLKVMRATAAVEQILELDQDLKKDVEVAGLDTVVPFIRTLGADNLNQLQALAGRASSANVVLIGRMPAASSDPSTKTRAPRAQSPLASFRFLRWGETGGDADGIESTQSSFGNECWQIAGESRPPGDYILESNDGVRITRQSVPVLPNWQTRIYVRRLPPNAAIDPAGLRPQDVVDVALHLSRSDRPLALEPQFEPSEVVRIALAAGRRIVSSRDALDIFLDEKFFDPLAGVAAAHSMFDGLERAEADAKSTRISKARLALQITRYDVQTVMRNLIGLMQRAQSVSTDMVALKLRAGMPLTDAERMIVTPPVYVRGWEKLIAVSLGASPQVDFERDVYRQCAANYAAGPYFAWAPTSVAGYVEHLIGSNRQTLRDVAASSSARASEATPMSVGEIAESIVSLVGNTDVNYATNLQKLLGPDPWRGLANAINQTEWMKKIGGRLAVSDMDRLQTAQDVAHAIGAKVATASASLASAARKTLSSPAKLVVALADEKNRAKFADRLNIPRSMLDAMLLPADDAQPAIPAGAALEAAAGTPSAEPISQRAFDMIVELEVTAKPTYERKYRKPTWPGVSSGVIIGIGYDVGYVSKAQLSADWSGVLPGDMVAALQKAVGVTGGAARGLAQELRRSVDVPWEAALTVHRDRVIPRWVGVVKRAVPNTGVLSPDCLGSLVSLTYNRGASYSRSGDRYREMRAIKSHMAITLFSRIPDEIRSMKRLWPDVPGLRRRREKEAALFEYGLSIGYSADGRR